MVLPIELSKESREPIYHQIENQIKALIINGYLKEGAPLPSIRMLSKDLETSVITIRRAYQDLEHEGFIKTSQGKGTFVAPINPGLQADFKTDAVQKAMENAIVTARHYDYTQNEIIDLFHQTLKNKS